MLLSIKKLYGIHNGKKNINDDKFYKVGAAVEFRLLVQDSVEQSNKAESPNNRSAKQSSVGTLLLRDKHLFLWYFYIFHVQNTSIITFLQ